MEVIETWQFGSIEEKICLILRNRWFNMTLK